MLLTPFILRFIYIVRVGSSWTDPKLLGSRTVFHSADPEILRPMTDSVFLGTGPGLAGLSWSRVSSGLILD